MKAKENAKSREMTLSTGTKVFLGKNAESNDELMKKFRGKENLILHTVKPGSPFCVIEKLMPNKDEIKEAGIVCAAKSQDWRDNKKDVELHLFSGKESKKPVFAKAGTWRIISKPRLVKVKKQEILKWEKQREETK